MTFVQIVIFGLFNHNYSKIWCVGKIQWLNSVSASKNLSDSPILLFVIDPRRSVYICNGYPILSQ